MLDQTLVYFAKIIPLILTFTTGAAACAYVAYWFGDTTAKADGRLTFNPLVHLDPIGSILLPGLLMFANAPFLFGYPKPLDLKESYLKPRKLGAFCVAFAGPGANILLAWISLLLLHINGQESTFGNDILINSVMINLGFATFSFLPLLPLPGGKMINVLLPHKWSVTYEKSERYTMFIIIGLTLLSSLIHIPILWIILKPLFQLLYTLISYLGGH